MHHVITIHEMLTSFMYVWGLQVVFASFGGLQGLAKIKRKIWMLKVIL
jgi:hypothetical protein